MTAAIRSATPQDAAALVRLRAAMFVAMGQDAGDADAAWAIAAAGLFERELGGSDVLVLVADDPEEGPVACAMAVLERRAPSPSNPAGLAAHLSQVSTLAAHRRRGLARACLLALLAELDGRGVARTDLFATDDGVGLYRGLGFRDSPYPALRRP